VNADPHEQGTTQKGFGKKIWQWFVSVATVLGIIVGVFTNSGKILSFLSRALSRADHFLFAGRISALLLHRADWFWTKLGLLFITTATGMALMVLLWGRLKLGRASLYLKLLASALLTFLLSILAIGMIAEIPYVSSMGEVAVLCPQCAQLGTCAIRTYASNGSADYSFDAKGEPRGPRGHAQITLRAFWPDEEQGAGWVIFLPRGSDLSSFQQLRFWIRGKKGSERIGVKVKDARGVEVPVRTIDSYVLGGGITANWREVSIPFEAFPRVDFGLMDNISLYVSGESAGTEPQTIYIGGMEWR
jgi:hypothetical protein